MSNSPVSTPRRDISVFRRLDEIPYVTFPMQIDRMLMVVCTAGGISATVDTETRHLTAGDVMVLRPGHYINDCKTDGDFNGFFATMTRDRLDHLLPTMQYIIPFGARLGCAPVIHLAEDEVEHLSLLCDLLCRQLKQRSRPYGGTALASLCETIFYTTLGIYSTRLGQAPGQSRREELLSRFIELLESNFTSQRTVKFYADRLCVTPKHLSAVVKESSGKTASDWIDQRVILEAKQLLRSTGMNVQEISAALNFANQSFFGKYFKHLTGMSPRDYRSNLPSS